MKKDITKQISTSVPIAQDSVSQQLMQLPTEHMLIAPATVVGGCGRPAAIGVVPPVSTVTATSTSTATVSTSITMLSAPLCGSI